MLFDPPLIKATLLRRYKRFLADAVLPDGTETVIHCPNPGAMTGLAEPGSTIWIGPATNPARKLRYTWRLTELPGGGYAGIDTGVPNRIVAEALAARRIPLFASIAEVRAEQRYGANSRIDFLLRNDDGELTYLEVKNVHLMRRPGVAEFPDCVTARGRKHLEELIEVRRAGHRAAVLFVVQMTGAERFTLASDIDPGFAGAARRAVAAGVDMLCHRAD
ncbi:MAG: DNA/RNA nuclease SfsA, partial [Rubricella sp.]